MHFEDKDGMRDTGVDSEKEDDYLQWAEGGEGVKCLSQAWVAIVSSVSWLVRRMLGLAQPN